MARRKPHDGKRLIRPYKQIPNEVLRSPQFASLSGNAVKVLLYLLAQYHGNNNGDLQAAQTEQVAAEIGIACKTQKAALKELLETRFIEISRLGGRNRCTLYALTFFAVDDCGDKLDIPPTHTFSDAWKEAEPRKAVRQAFAQSKTRRQGSRPNR